VVDLFPQGRGGRLEKLSARPDRGWLARLAYTYLHLPIVGGIILAAVADELVLKHPHGHSDRTVLTRPRPAGVSGRTVLFQARNPRLPAAFTASASSRCHGWLGRDLSPLWLSTLTTAIMIVVAAWNRYRYARSRRNSVISGRPRSQHEIGQPTTSARSRAYISSSRDTTSDPCRHPSRHRHRILKCG
jgi:low temperature requirement protein LtrA